MDSTTTTHDRSGHDRTANDRTLDEAALRNDLRGALERHEFRVYYQPVVGFDTAAVTGFEALLRWEHPEYGVLAPAQFLAIAEASGLIVPIGAAVLETACQQAAEWRRETVDGRALTISVNLSARQLLAHDLLGSVVRALANSGLDASLLVLEITEATLLEVATNCADLLHDLVSLGVQLCVDDFGAEHGSLRVLRELPVTSVKLDRTFLRRAVDDTDGASATNMVGALSAFAHALDLSVVAQGIDTVGQFTDARALGCDRGQGCYFALPQPGAIVQALVHHRFTWRAEHSAA